MHIQQLINEWFHKWETGDYTNLPITEDFIHESPFGEISGKKTYLALVQSNEDKFLGYTFSIIDAITCGEKACVRYVAKQDDFELNVSEWYYAKNDKIQKIVAYYHIGDIQTSRQLTGG
ncbi:nuclear transport factor 2 family protein [Thalassotalea euphylliae]|uniref:nuclear transport factor 2 family protein n=1 Tax=Thalassotalea euphylliae TaxID=1655234 RepID=UPI003632B194